MLPALIGLALTNLIFVILHVRDRGPSRPLSRRREKGRLERFSAGDMEAEQD